MKSINWTLQPTSYSLIVIRSALFAMFALFETSASARVKNPAGIATKGEGLEKGFLQTFPDYKRRTEKLSDKKTLDGLKRYFKDAPEGQTVHNFKSREPESTGKDGKTYLSFSVSEISFKNEAKAKMAISELGKYGKKDRGYSFAQDFAVLLGKKVYWLKQSCLFSNTNASLMRVKLQRAIGNDLADRMLCGCGTGCHFLGKPPKKP